MTEVQRATIKATIGALRYAAGLAFCWREELAADLYDTARELEGDLARDSVDGLADCCPVCQEVICDGGCPLEDLRAGL